MKDAWEEFFKYAEANWPSYERPKDWEQRLERIKKRARKPVAWGNSRFSKSRSG